MAVRRHLGMATVVTASLVLAPAASAQPSRDWVDPPGHEGVPAPPAPAEMTPPPAAALPEAQPREPAPAPQALQPARPPAGPAEATLPSLPHPADTTASVASREDVARNLAVAYLDAWSSPNDEALEATEGCYAPMVTFHGQVMSVRALLEEKRRFVRRWPDRRYVPRPDTLGVFCQDAAETCTVQSVFDFDAANPRTGRRARGVATLELVVSFGGSDAPTIVAENSTVHGRGDATVPGQ
jgi:hypothetical protein